MRTVAICCLTVLVGAHAACLPASEKRPLNGLVEKHMARLADERFSERESAMRALSRLGPEAFPLLKRLLETAEEQELRIRLQSIVKRLALIAESDPEELAAYAREEAEAERFAASARFYARAATAFRDRAAMRGSKERLFWEERARRAELRARRAEEWAAALHAGRVMEQAGRAFIILTREANGQSAVEYQEIDLQLLTDW